jgi:hypothetical protein
MSRKITGLFFIVLAILMVRCAAKKTAVAVEKSTPAPEAQVLEPIAVNPAPDRMQLKATPIPEETRKTLDIAEGVEHGATQYWLNQGKEMLGVQCATCHKAKDPLKYDEASWVKHMSRMVPKAKLTEDQAKYLRVYTLTLIRSNSEK